MYETEVCLLTALCPARRTLYNPWRFTGFKKLIHTFLQGHLVLMGRETWFDFPFKEDLAITPWVLSNNQEFQLRTRARYPHVRFADTYKILDYVYPLKNIWWVLGSFSMTRQLITRFHSVEAILVNDTVGLVNNLSNDLFTETHRSINPYDQALECVRYERFQIPEISMQHVQV